MAAVEGKGAGFGAVAAERVEHLAAKFGEHGGVVFSVDEEGVAVGAHAAFDVGHGADRGPEVAQFLDGNVVAKALPDVVGGHALADDVGVVSRKMEEAAGFDGGVVHKGDVADRGAETGAEDADARVALLLEPAEAAASVMDGLAVGLEREADIGTADLVGALVSEGHAAVVIGHAHFEDRDADALEPLAEAALAVPFGVPVREEEDGGRFFVGALGIGFGGEKLAVNGVVFRPGRGDGAGEGEDVVGAQGVVGRGSGGEPVAAVGNDVLGVLADEGGRVGIVGIATEVFQAPVEGLHATVVVGSPAAVLVAADFAFEPVHRNSYQLTVYNSE